VQIENEKVAKSNGISATAEIEKSNKAGFPDNGGEVGNMNVKDVKSCELFTAPKNEKELGGSSGALDGSDMQETPPFDRKPATAQALKQGSVTGRNYRAELTDFYEKHNPSKLDEVDAILKHFKGNEERMLQLVEEKYGGSQAR